MKSICVFCGAKENVTQDYKDLAYKTGKTIAENGLAMVYGGSNTGLMLAASEGAMDHGGKVIGIYPKILQEKEPFNAKITDPVLVGTMGSRKEIMLYNSDAFIALPGGTGTMDEVFEVITLKTLGAMSRKPMILVNYNGYWDIFKKMIDHFVDEGFL